MGKNIIFAILSEKYKYSLENRRHFDFSGLATNRRVQVV
jgi:hypothetical protein